MIKYNLSGTWKLIKYVYTNVSGAWKTVGQIYTNVNGTWKPMWSYQWKTGNWGNCSVECGGGTQSRSVTCGRNDGQTVLDSLCTKYVGSKPATSQKCNTQACGDCRYSKDSTPYSYLLQYRMFEDDHTDIYFNGSAIITYLLGFVESYTSNGYIYTPGEFKESGIYYEDAYWYEVCRSAV